MKKVAFIVNILLTFYATSLSAAIKCPFINTSEQDFVNLFNSIPGNDYDRMRTYAVYIHQFVEECEKQTVIEEEKNAKLAVCSASQGLYLDLISLYSAAFLSSPNVDGVPTGILFLIDPTKKGADTNISNNVSYLLTKIEAFSKNLRSYTDLINDIDSEDDTIELETFYKKISEKFETLKLELEAISTLYARYLTLVETADLELQELSAELSEKDSFLAECRAMDDVPDLNLNDKLTSLRTNLLALRDKLSKYMTNLSVTFEASPGILTDTVRSKFSQEILSEIEAIQSNIFNLLAFDRLASKVVNFEIYIRKKRIGGSLHIAYYMYEPTLRIIRNDMAIIEGLIADMSTISAPNEEIRDQYLDKLNEQLTRHKQVYENIKSKGPSYYLNRQIRAVGIIKGRYLNEQSTGLCKSKISTYEEHSKTDALENKVILDEIYREAVNECIKK